MSTVDVLDKARRYPVAAGAAVIVVVAVAFASWPAPEPRPSSGLPVRLTPEIAAQLVVGDTVKNLQGTTHKIKSAECWDGSKSGPSLGSVRDGTDIAHCNFVTDGGPATGVARIHMKGGVVVGHEAAALYR